MRMPMAGVLGTTFLLLLSGCAQAAPAATIGGQVTYLQRIALPEGAVVTVQLVDISRADAAAVVLGEQVITPQMQVPIPFSIAYDPTVIQDNLTYALQASIRDAQGQLWFTTTTAHLVITRGYPSDAIDLLLEMVR
ncbi:MAG: YbaY family lipoprotein [Anaerolineales bacterium]|nr:YbaY family lipoprotein [Anaerolineales bacterium]